MIFFFKLNIDNNVPISPLIHSSFCTHQRPPCVKAPSDLPWAKLLGANDLWMITGLNDKETMGKGP